MPGGREASFIFHPISSCEMSRGRFFEALNSNLEEFLDHIPLGVYMGGGGKGRFLFFNQYHHVRCLEVGFLGC